MTSKDQFQQITMSMDLKLIQIGKKKSDVAKAIGISQQLFWNYCRGMYKHVTPEKLEQMINEAMQKL